MEENVDIAIKEMKWAITSLKKSKDANAVGVDYYLGVALSHIEQAHIHAANAVAWNNDPLRGVK